MISYIGLKFGKIMHNNIKEMTIKVAMGAVVLWTSCLYNIVLPIPIKEQRPATALYDNFIFLFE